MSGPTVALEPLGRLGAWVIYPRCPGGNSTHLGTSFSQPGYICGSCESSMWCWLSGGS